MIAFIKQLVILFIIMFVASSYTFAASTWRCSGGLVSSGNTQVEVIYRCGEPSTKNFLGWGRRVADDWRNYFEDVPIEEWIYPVSNRLYYVLKFEGNRLTEVSSHYSQ